MSHTPCHSSVVMVHASHTSSIISAIMFATSGSWADMFATCLTSSWVVSALPCDFTMFMMSVHTSWSALLSANGFTESFIFSNHSFAIAYVSIDVVLVQSPASLFVFSQACFIIDDPIFSIGSLHSTALATVTQSLVIVGYDPFSMATFLPFGHIVTFTVSDTSFIHFIIESLTPVRLTCFMSFLRFQI